MSQPVITAEPGDTVTVVAKLMDKHNIGSIVIVDKQKIHGIVTERDIIRKVIAQDKDPHFVKASDVMTANVRTADIDASIMEIAANMKKHTMRRIVVVKEGAPVGIITSRDLIGLLV